MSRIYEALERSEKERNDRPASEQEAGATLMSAGRDDEGRASGTASQFFDTIRRFTWKPSMVSLPTLSESGLPAEQFRSLRSSIYQFRDQITLKTILVSSGVPTEGKTFVAANLAISLARNSERPVLLIDADLRRPSIHRLLGGRDTPGLMQYLSGQVELIDILQRDNGTAVASTNGLHAISNLALIPAGGITDAPELIGNQRIEELIASVSPHFAWVVIDSPPVLAVTDAVDLARAADGVLLVARSAETKFDVAQRAQAAFANARLLGFVLNAVRDAPRSSYYYYYGGETKNDPPARSKAHRSRA
jgi:capsular exopolysaccharide synthesis family protein